MHACQALSCAEHEQSGHGSWLDSTCWAVAERGACWQVFTLDRTSTHLQELATSRMQIPFFVKSTAEFDQKYPTASAYR